MSRRDIRHRSIPVGGVRVHVATSMCDHGRPIVLCHGNSSSVVSFDGLLRGRVGGDHPLIAIDFPGHGDSDRAADLADYSLTGLGRFVQAVIAEMGLREYFLCGHSLGGHVLSHLAPELHGALGLVLISAPPLSPKNLGAVFRPDPTGGALFRAELDARQALAFATNLVRPDCVAERVIDALAATIAKTDEQFRPALGRSIAAGEIRDEGQTLASARIPIAFCGGARDPFLQSTWREEIPRGLEHELWRIEEAGHSPHVEAPATFEKLLQMFLVTKGVTARAS